MALNIGIDFGTSTIYVTRWNEKKQCAEHIPNITRSSAEKFIENIVYYESKENLILGQKAKNKGVAYPENLISYVKRHIEEDQWSTYVKNLDAEITASQVTTDIFKFLKKRIEEIHGGEQIESVVLSVPFAFEDQERSIIQSCAKKAGLNVIKLIEEPISAGISYGFFHDTHFETNEPQTVLIFDLGGGTFDIAIFKLFKQNNELNIEVLGTGGDKLLGGKDIDDTIFYKFCKQLGVKLTEIDQKLSRRDQNDLKNEAKNLKENLSESESYEAIVSLRDCNQVLEYEVSVDDFNEWLIETNFIKKITSTLNSTLQKTKLKSQDIDKIILVGGTTNIPLVHQTVEDYFKKKIEMLKNPAELVGEGNGILCGALNDHQLQFNLISNHQQLNESTKTEDLNIIPPQTNKFSFTENVKNKGGMFSFVDSISKLGQSIKEVTSTSSISKITTVIEDEISNLKDKSLAKINEITNEVKETKETETLVSSLESRIEDLRAHIKTMVNPSPESTNEKLWAGLAPHEKDNQRIKSIKAQIKLDPNNSDLYHNLGYAYSEIDLYDKAVEAFNQEVLLSPNDKHAHFQLAFNLAELKQYDQAIEHYKKAIEIDPKDEFSYNNLGIIYDELNRHQDIISLYHQYLNHFSDNKHKAFKKLAKACKELDNKIEAIKYYELYIQIKPNDSYVHFQIAYLSNELKDYEKAKIHYQKVIDLDPKDKHVYNNLGNIYKNQKDYKKAIDLYKKSISITPDYLYSYQGLAYSLDESQQYNEAIIAYKKVIELDPKDKWAYKNLGYLYRNTKEYSNAIEHFAKAIKINPEDADAYFQIAYIYGEMKKPHDAIEYYQKSIDIKPENALAYNNLGCEYSNLKDDKKAMRAFSRALEIDPNHELARKNLAGYH